MTHRRDMSDGRQTNMVATNEMAGKISEAKINQGLQRDTTMATVANATIVVAIAPDFLVLKRTSRVELKRGLCHPLGDLTGKKRHPVSMTPFVNHEGGQP